MTKAEQYKSLCFETLLTIDELTKSFRHFLPGLMNERNDNRFADALRSNSEDFEDLPTIIKRVSSVMQDICFDFTGDVSTLSSIRKKVDELNSILHIGRSYPDSAMRRLKVIKSSFNVEALRKKNK